MSDASTAETWRPIPDCNGWYEVSDLGRVRSWKTSGTSPRRASTPRILKPDVVKAGYARVSLSNVVKVNYTIHALVALAFLGARPDGLEVAHGNGDKLDNRLVNLRYATHVQNIADDRANDTRRNMVRTDAEVRAIRASQTPITALAKQYRACPKSIRKIRDGITYQSVV